MDNQDWLILKILAEKKNISKTALSLYLSQPALTNRLQKIEKEFGVTIVNRGRRGISFTPEGEYLSKCAAEMLIKLETIKETVINMNKEVISGTLKLGVSRFIMKYKLPIILKLFKEQYPNVEFKIVADWSRDIFNLVYTHEVHISFVRGDYGWCDEKHLLFEENMCVVSKNKISLEDLPKLPQIDYQTDILSKLMIDNWWSDNYSSPPIVSMKVDHADTSKEMIINDLGYSIIPRTVINDTKDLHIINLTNKNGEPLLRKTWMLFHKKSLDINVVKAFVDFIKDFDLENI